MPRLSSGLVIAGAYADKIRRTLFAQLRDAVKQGKISGQRVAYAAAQLNRVLYTILVENLKVDKGDVVRVRIEYELDEEKGEIVWKWDTMSLEVFRRVPQEEVDNVIKSIVKTAAELSVAAVEYAIEKLGETKDGDLIYLIRLGDKEVGAVEVLPVNDNLAVLKKGAVIEPTPAVFEKARMDISKSLEEDLKQILSRVISSARHVSVEEARKVIDYLKSRVGAKPIEVYEEEEE
ncbi:MAG: DUF2258 domain-containing protein [Thermoprotei archaeon]|nr:MAG: DUF2258 domain-containing protein [Thermoprotei archaeon]